MYDPSKTGDERVADLLSDWNKVLKEPKATDKFILGHSHLRWSSFLKVSLAKALKRTAAKVFIAQGTRDTNSLPESAEMLCAELLAHGRNVMFERVENGDHAFMTPGDKTGEGWFETNKKAIQWFLDGR